MTAKEQSKNIISTLEELSNEFPTIGLGTILQAAIDTKKKIKNFNIADVSQKEILTSLKEYQEKLKKGHVKTPRGEE